MEYNIMKLCRSIAYNEPRYGDYSIFQLFGAEYESRKVFICWNNSSKYTI